MLGLRFQKRISNNIKSFMRIRKSKFLNWNWYIFIWNITDISLFRCLYLRNINTRFALEWKIKLLFNILKHYLCFMHPKCTISICRNKDKLYESTFWHVWPSCPPHYNVNCFDYFNLSYILWEGFTSKILSLIRLSILKPW